MTYSRFAVEGQTAFPTLPLAEDEEKVGKDGKIENRNV
jgi:hypothetical protein